MIPTSTVRDVTVTPERSVADARQAVLDACPGDWNGSPCDDCKAKAAARTAASPNAPREPRSNAPSARKDRPREPHAFAVETLWNRGGHSERWGLAMELEDIRQPLDRSDAEELMAQMIEDGHAPDAVRLVALAVVEDPTPSTGCSVV